MFLSGIHFLIQLNIGMEVLLIWGLGLQQDTESWSIFDILSPKSQRIPDSLVCYNDCSLEPCWFAGARPWYPRNQQGKFISGSQNIIDLIV